MIFMILATNNCNKLKEIKDILNDYEIKSLRDVQINIDIKEDKDSFYDNALTKAKTIFEITKESVIADDSGLEIHALNNWPSVLSSRFLGSNKSDEERNLAILKKMENITNRKASFICILVYYDGNNIIVGKGELVGNITYELRGNNGFGFDSIFELDNGKTLAELNNDEKNKISARYLASIDLLKKLKDYQR